MILAVAAATSFQAEIEDTLKKQSIKYELCDLSKPSEMELFRIFADNQNYVKNFDIEHIHDVSDHDFNSIEKSIALALRWPDALIGPFLIYRGRILNREKMKEQLQLEQ